MNAGITTLIEFIFIFGMLIFLHEFGHFFVAKLSKIEVEEFGFGFPPRLVKLFTFSGTEITLNWIPLGGFVKLKGENEPDVPGGMAASNPFKRLGVLLGGSTMNLLTGILLFSIVFSQIGAPDFSKVEIMEVAAGSPAAMAGIQSGDIFYEIEDQRINSTEELSRLIRENVGKEISITIMRANELIQMQVTPRETPPEGQGALGIVMGNPTRTINVIQAIPSGVYIALEQARQLISLPGQLILGQVNPEEARLVGPKGIYDMFSQVREQDQDSTAASGEQGGQEQTGLNTIWFTAIISVAIGLTNLLPLPALDGGRILFLLPEILFKKRVPPKYENMIHFIGFSLLILLMLYITTQDFINPIQLP